MARAAIGIGSNRGDRLGFLKAAIEALRGSLQIVAVSSVYETSPMYVLNQDDYLNGALLAETDLGPLALLKLLKATELQIGRTPAERNGPREIDLDLLSFGRLNYRFISLGRTVLQVPHPRTPERRFVLQPLSEIAPDLCLPGLGTVQELLSAAESRSESVRLFDDAVLSLSSSRA